MGWVGLAVSVSSTIFHAGSIPDNFSHSFQHPSVTRATSSSPLTPGRYDLFPDDPSERLAMPENATIGATQLFLLSSARHGSRTAHHRSPEKVPSHRSIFA